MKSILITILLAGTIQGLYSQSDLAYVETPITSQTYSTTTKASDINKEIPKPVYLAEKTKKLQMLVTTYDITKSEVYVPNTPGTYTVNFNEGSNQMEAVYGPDGALLKSEGVFENVPVPYAIGSSLAKEYPGWEFFKSYCYSSYSIEMELTIYYKIILKKGNKTKTVKINPADYSL